MREIKSGKFIGWYTVPIIVAVSTVGGFVSYKWLGGGFWLGFGLVAFGMFVNGWIATIEDEGPGGFNNPRATGKGRGQGK